MQSLKLKRKSPYKLEVHEKFITARLEDDRHVNFTLERSRRVTKTRKIGASTGRSGQLRLNVDFLLEREYAGSLRYTQLMLNSKNKTFI